MVAAGLALTGTLAELLRVVDIVVDCTPKGVGAANVATYRAAGVGAICLILACTGLAVLPTRPWAVVVILLSMFAFAVDVQVGIPRFWTGVGIVGTIIASLFLFESLPGTSLRPSWIALITGIGGITLTFIVGMPNMVRTRFATPTIGREWMIGEEGVVISDVDPEGIVEVGEGRWRALCPGHRTPRKPPHRQSAARSLGPSGRPRQIQFLPQPRR